MALAITGNRSVNRLPFIEYLCVFADNLIRQQLTQAVSFLI